MHRKLLSENGYKPSLYLYIKDTENDIVFLNIVTKVEVRFSKNQGIFI